MEHKIFAIFDVKAKAYLPPFFLPERGMALRTFSDCVNSKDHQFGLHPQDYTLFEFGEWFSDSGVFQLALAPKAMANGVELIRQEPEVRQVALPLNGDEPFEESLNETS